MTTEPISSEARREGVRALGPAIRRAIENQVVKVFQARHDLPAALPLAARGLIPEISREFTFEILGERTPITKIAAAQLQSDFAARGIHLTNADAEDLFHKSLIAGGVGVAAALVGTRGAAAGPLAVLTGQALATPLIRERRRRQTLMSVAAKNGAVTRGGNGRITGLAPRARAVQRRLQIVERSRLPEPDKRRRCQGLRKEFAKVCREIGEKNRGTRKTKRSSRRNRT